MKNGGKILENLGALSEIMTKEYYAGVVLTIWLQYWCCDLSQANVNTVLLDCVTKPCCVNAALTLDDQRWSMS